MNSRPFKRIALAAMVATVLAAPQAHATVNAWDTNWTPENGFGGLSSTWSSSAVGSAYAAWNNFDSPYFDYTPDAGSFGVIVGEDDGTFVSELTGQAFLTGGNIYSFSAATSFLTSIQGVGMSGTGVRDIALRIETRGSPLDEASVLLGGTIAPTSRHFQGFVDVGAPGGQEEEWVFVWKNVENGGGAFTFYFDAATSSMSLSQAAMYFSPVTAVPEPHEWALMLAGLGVVGTMARARRRDGHNKIG